MRFGVRSSTLSIIMVVFDCSLRDVEGGLEKRGGELDALGLVIRFVCLLESLFFGSWILGIYETKNEASLIRRDLA